MRLKVTVCLVANSTMRTPGSEFISVVVVPTGVDVADEYIEDEAGARDIVITADIPLAAKIVEKGAIAINPRGEIYNKDNVQQRLATRNMLDELRSSGLVTGGPAPFKATDTHKFASALDRLLAKRLNEEGKQQ